MEKEKIESKANEIIQDHENIKDCGFVDVLKLAQNLGFVVGNSNLENSEDGFIIVDLDAKELFGYKTQKVIAVNSSRDFPTKRFIIAHELGHYIFENNSGKIYAHREHKGRNENENNIDYFAACLLMPKEMFIAKAVDLKNSKIYGEKLVEKISELFAVPYESAKRRFEEVGVSINGQ